MTFRYGGRFPREDGQPSSAATKGINIGQAVEALKKGRRVARAGWNGKGMWLQLVSYKAEVARGSVVYEQSPYVEMKAADDKLAPWLCSQTDMLAEDWEIVG